MSEVTVTDSLIAENEVANGGGVYSQAGTGEAVSTITIIRSRVAENRATQRGGGNAVAAETGLSTARLVISDSVISANRAGFGGGVFQDRSSNAWTRVLVQDSALASNEATMGGGFAVRSPTAMNEARFVNSTISAS